MLLRYFLLLTASLLLPLCHYAQVNDQGPAGGLRVSAAFNQLPPADILRQLERDYPLRFYYRPSDLPTAPRTVNWQDVPLEVALEELLAEAGLGFFIYRHYAVAIAPAQVIDANFSADYYQALARSRLAPAATPASENTLVVGELSQLDPSGQAIVQGFIVDDETDEPIIGATVQWPDLGLGASADELGVFATKLPTGLHRMQVQYLGYATLSLQVQVYGNGRLDLRLRSTATDLETVIVQAQTADDNVSSARVGVARIDIKRIEKLPTFLGEKDVVRALLLSPGVSTVGEGAAGYNVRGGAIDQNLILQDEALIINATHALGFFSTLNSDLISEVELYKGNIPAQYGGRLASVLDVTMRDGHFERYRWQGGLGLVSGRLSVEGPVIKNRASFIVGGRASYSDWLLQRINVLEVQRSSASFYDFNVRYTHKLNQRHTLTVAGYTAADQFVYNRTFGFNYAAYTGQLQLKSVLSDKWFSRFTLAYTDYESTQDNLDELQGGRLTSGLTYLKAKEQLTYVPMRDLRIDLGAAVVRYGVNPGERSPLGSRSLVSAAALPTEQGLESALFGQAEWTANPRLSVAAGLRLNVYAQLGPGNEATYAAGQPRETDNITGATSFARGKVMASYFSPEPRVSARYRLSPSGAIKAGYSRTSQFINQIFNTATPTPTAQYQLSTAYIPPFLSHNFSLGYFRNFRQNVWESSVEGYYRVIDQLWDYRDFADLVVNPTLETEILVGSGRAYGLELSLKGKTGKFNGQAGYTLARTEQQVQGINQGRWYPSNFDQPHNLNFLLNFQANQRHTFTLNFTFNTGRPTTAPITSYRVNGSPLIIPVYSDRNQLRIPDYHRLDLSYSLGQGYNRKRTVKTTWNLTLYNVYARRNAFSVFFTQDINQNTVANRLAILGSIFPAITFNFQTQ